MTNPVAVDFLKSLTYKFGLDPKQQIDMNDPMTRLVMAISIATTEQGENIYSYDQYIKGCAESAGIDPAVFDSEVNPTSLGIENNNPSTGTNASSGGGSAGGSSGNTSGYVSPKLPKIVAGGSSLPTTLISQYAAVGTAAILENPAFQNVFGGIPISKISTSSVLDSLGFQNAAASVRAAELAASGTVLAAGSVITAASAGVPVSFNPNATPSAGLTPDVQSAINDFSAKWGANPNAITGVLAVESSFSTSVGGGASGNYTGIFQLGNNQIPVLTKQVFGESLTPAQYSQLGVTDQLKVMDQYYANYGIKPGFFTGDAATDTAKAWALQLAPANAKNIDYNNPNAVISRTNQAGVISAQPGLVTVGSSTGSLARGGTIPTATPVTNPGQLGLPDGTYTKTGLTPATPTDEGYTTYKDSSGNEFYRYKDGSVYDSNDKLVTPPTGVPASYKQETLNSDGSYTYTDPSNGKTFTQSADLKTIKDSAGEVIPPQTPATGQTQDVTPTPGTRSAAIETTPLADPKTGMTEGQTPIANQINQLNDRYASNANYIDEVKANYTSAQQQLTDYQMANPGDRSSLEYGRLEAQAQHAAEQADPTINTNLAEAQAQNEQIPGLIQGGTDAYVDAGATTSIPGVVQPASVPTPDTGVVSSSNITPGSQAQTNAANAAAGGMGAPGC